MRCWPLAITACAAACATASSPPVNLGSRPGGSQDTIYAVTYMTGGIRTPAWKLRNERPFGKLVVGDSALAFLTDRGAHLFELPLSLVKEAASSVENAGPSVANRIMFGGLASASRDEMLGIRIETDSAADVLMFKMRQRNTSQAAAAKIRFRAERLRR